MDVELDPLWHDLDWAIGQMLIMGWDGTEVTPQIRHLIQDHHLGSILLTAKNLQSAHQTARLVHELQTIAHQAGHPQPLLIALDQENGGVNSLFDEDYICQFPSSMGQAAAGSADLAYEVAKATAIEVSAVGVNLILGPVLDVLTNARYQPLGVRAIGDDPQEVSQYGIGAINGYKDAGVATCGKHFPSYGNLDFLGSTLDIPIITQTLEELSLSALVPFRSAIATGKLDAMFVGGCGISNPSMSVNHACLSEQVVDDLLRNELGFTGVAISECLEMEALRTEIGVKTGTVMAVEAGCDLVLLCRAYDVQLEAIAGLKLGVENEVITKDRIYTSLKRVLRMKMGCTSWAQALNPPGISLLSTMHSSNLALSLKAYDNSITVMRDADKLLPLNESMHQEEELLLLTPLVKPLPASAMTKSIIEAKGKTDAPQSVHDQWIHHHRGAIMSGEGVFREFGKSLARARHGKLLHTSYTANGVRPVHENLVQRASCIIIVTADANRNLYQLGFTKHVAMMCSMLRATGQKKSLVVVAVSSPYDFAMDKTIGTYICTFDFTETAMSSLVRALFGDFTPRGTLPGTLRKSRKSAKSRQHWLVEAYDRDRDGQGLQDLLHALARASTPNQQFLQTTTPAAFELSSPNVAESHFVVRNSSTHALYGFCATYSSKGVGIVGALFVDPAKRNVSIGRSLHRRALRALTQRPGLTKLQLGLGFPGVFPGIPVDDNTAALKAWFAAAGWDLQPPTTRLTNLAIPDLGAWSAPEALLQSLRRAGIAFDLVRGGPDANAVESVLTHVATHAAGPEVFELYRLALRTCGVVRAKSALDSLLGTVVVCSPGSALAGFVPALQPVGGEMIGGVVAPVVPATAQAGLVLQGLVMMGARQSKAGGAGRCVVSWVGEGAVEGLKGVGLDVVGAWEQVVNSPEGDPVALTIGKQPVFFHERRNAINQSQRYLPIANDLSIYDFDPFPPFPDPFSYPYEPTHSAPHAHSHLPGLGANPSQPPPATDSPSPQTLDTKLLSFTPSPLPLTAPTLLNPSTNLPVPPSITAELYGLFFVAEDVTAPTSAPRPLELTCYRRNLWQCSGHIALPRCAAPLILVDPETGRRSRVAELLATVSAMESIEGKEVEIISVPWKSGGGGGGGGPPPGVPVGEDGRVGWKRLQFKSATANNGRRKGAQQHFVVRVGLWARGEGGEGLVKVGEVRSGAVIVRGRSPRNFDGRGDVPVPVSGEGEGGKKGSRVCEPTHWSSSTSNPFPTTAPTHPHKKLALAPTPPRPPVPSWDSTSKLPTKSSSTTASTPRTSGGPIALSLSEDDRTPQTTTTPATTTPSTDGIPTPPGLTKQENPSSSATTLDLPATAEEDMLYEYFPLSLDDWMPPVDAVYRPHVVHHTIVPPEARAQQARGRGKRYFAAE
ncbi:hypothetical protein QBC39DRAFT_426255 [Podospora conica]|nr:hypothetical protein QBC39DRAFT_426255 [Schizothecium conicum]